ncbi:hypothetical protein CASFOL_028131 [Castilleja foliolosa]|uniref:Uncharacterized protein n=1 Tax=Castilleja foliolosa TaxID=1961234 RepID=A0ABD3CFB7_9LAMI
MIGTIVSGPLDSLSGGGHLAAFIWGGSAALFRGPWASDSVAHDEISSWWRGVAPRRRKTAPFGGDSALVPASMGAMWLEVGRHIYFSGED